MRANPSFSFTGTALSSANAYGGNPVLNSSSVDHAGLTTTNTVAAGGVLFLRVGSTSGNTLKLEFSSEL
jgi:hypothetical protein